MDAKGFSEARTFLGKTQDQLARLLCVSSKAIQSFEQGWRDIPPYVERQTLLLLSLKRSQGRSIPPCWEVRNCPHEQRENCTAWEFKAGHFCWLITGTFCQGQVQEGWNEKVRLCRECEVYRSTIPAI